MSFAKSLLQSFALDPDLDPFSLSLSLRPDIVTNFISAINRDSRFDAMRDVSRRNFVLGDGLKLAFRHRFLVYTSFFLRRSAGRSHSPCLKETRSGGIENLIEINHVERTNCFLLLSHSHSLSLFLSFESSTELLLSCSSYFTALWLCLHTSRG